MKDILQSVRWGWAIAAALVAQLLLIPTNYALGAAAAWLGWTGGFLLLTRTATLLLLFLAGVWVGRKAQRHFTANGFFVGLIAALIFLPVLIAIQPPYPVGEAISESMKILGGTLGGGLVGHRTRRGIRRRARVD